jgi:hypothetical protein
MTSGLSVANDAIVFAVAVGSVPASAIVGQHNRRRPVLIGGGYGDPGRPAVSTSFLEVAR